jgi:PleD family two-component response regulator
VAKIEEVSIHERFSPSFSFGPRTGISYQSGQPEDLLHMKILVVDDHALIREALRGVLKELKEDATILEASDWQETTSLLQEHSDVDLILLDLGLPDKNGFTALTQRDRP